jgi:hypothetical protein
MCCKNEGGAMCRYDNAFTKVRGGRLAREQGIHRPHVNVLNLQNRIKLRHSLSSGS